MDDHPPVTPPGGTGCGDEDADGAAAGRPAAGVGPAGETPAGGTPAGEAPAGGPAADGPPAGDAGRQRESTRPEGYEPL